MNIKEIRENIKIPPLKELIKKENLKKYFKHFIGLDATPAHLAWSVAIGVFIGFIIPIGFQTFIMIPLAMALRINVLVSYLATIVSNPLSAIPMYYVAVQIGQFFTGISIKWDMVENFIYNPTTEKLLQFSSDTITVFFVGSFIQGLASAVALYFITYKLVVHYRKKLHHEEGPKGQPDKG